MSSSVLRWIARGKAVAATVALPLLLASPAFAQSNVKDTLDAVASPAYGDSNPDALTQIIGSLIQTALGLVGIILVVLVVYAGFLWMTAAGEEEKITKAKEILQSAVIGLIIVMMAASITFFVVRAVSSASQNTGNASDAGFGDGYGPSN